MAIYTHLEDRIAKSVNADLSDARASAIVISHDCARAVHRGGRCRVGGSRRVDGLAINVCASLSDVSGNSTVQIGNLIGYVD